MSSPSVLDPVNVHTTINEKLQNLQVQTPMTTDDMKNAYSIIFNTIFGMNVSPPSDTSTPVVSTTQSVPEYQQLITEKYTYDPEKREYLAETIPTVSKQERQFIIYDCSFGHFTIFNIRKNGNTIFLFSMLHNGKNYKMSYNPDDTTSPLMNYTNPEFVGDMLDKRDKMANTNTKEDLRERWNKVVVPKIIKVFANIKL